MHITLHVPSLPDGNVVDISDSAAKRARMTFNPSNADRVNRIKALVAALYSECEAVIADAGGEGSRGTAQREAATAMTHIQAGAMFAVSAATAHLA